MDGWMDGNFIHTFTNNNEDNKHDKSTGHPDRFVVDNQLDILGEKYNKFQVITSRFYK